MTPTTNLANAARRLCDARAGEGFDTLEHELAKALDDYDAQELLKIDVRNRLSDRQLAEIFTEEYVKVVAQEPSAEAQEFVDQAVLQAMRRIADYAEYLLRMICLLQANADLEGLLYKVRDQEQLGWEGPKVKAAGEAIAAMLAEAKVSRPKPPVDNSAEAGQNEPLGHA